MLSFIHITKTVKLTNSERGLSINKVLLDCTMHIDLGYNRIDRYKI